MLPYDEIPTSPCILDGTERLVDSLIHDKIDFDDIVTAENLVTIGVQQSSVRHGTDIPIRHRNQAFLTPMSAASLDKAGSSRRSPLYDSRTSSIYVKREHSVADENTNGDCLVIRE
ncbi:MAG: hypothetical protein U0M19_05195 [Caecibacter sp.]|nr:hypothetical protein [Caecibacter sp.]